MQDANIRRGWKKWLEVANALAYYAAVLITPVESFTAQAYSRF